MAVLLTRLKQISLIKQYYVVLRLCHTPSPIVRVRFAPSPTGFLHLGSLRTALFNYLFAKANNGKFILRIEDTDQSRLVEGATDKLCEDLSWAGMHPDEGPQTGGPFGPYVQSERLNIYKTEVEKLLENGSAYYCFCSERRIDLLRKEAIRARQIPKYDNKCRHLTPGQIAQKLANNDKYCIRFQLDSNENSFNDLIYGGIQVDITLNEGDPVIIKTDGFPTYHFANVVDDHLMKITHVLRGVEWQVSTPKHIMMYRAFGWSPPTFGHLPLIMNPDGSKLSKRQGDIQLSYYCEKGIFPEALLNFITQSGGGFEKIQTESQTSFSMNELVKLFDVKRINAHSSRLNTDLLDTCNQLELIKQLNDPTKVDKLVSQVQELVKRTYPESKDTLDLGSNHVKSVLKWASSRITSINQLVDEKMSFLWILPKLTNETDLKPELIDFLIRDLDVRNFTKVNLQEILKKFSSKNNLTFGKFMKSLRSMLSGLKEGPGVAEMMEILGKEHTLLRIKNKKK